MIKPRLSTYLLAMVATTMMAQQPLRVEYFLDSDPGYGLAATISNLKIGDNVLTFDLRPFKDGAHLLSVRCQDDRGFWSTTISRPLFIDRYQDIVYVEYFYDDNDPGLGNATPVGLPDQEYKGNLTLDLSLDISGLALGEHRLSVRALDRYDQWTDEMTRTFTIVEHNDNPDPPVDPIVEEGDLARLEYFFDNDPGYGNGTPLSKPSIGTNTYLMSFEGVTPGAHILSLRAWDENNHWSQTISHPIYVCSVKGLNVTRLEYYFDNNDPGEGKAIPVTLPTDPLEQFAFDVSVEDMAEGSHQFSIRACDDKGKWSLVRSEPFTITMTGEGIATLTWNFPIDILLANGVCTVKDLTDGTRGNSRVEIFNASGMLLGASEWPKGMHILSLSIRPNSQRSTILVKVTDLEKGCTVVRHLMMKND